MIIVYIILLFIAVLLFMLLLGFIDIVYNSNLVEKFCEAMNVIVGVICAAVCGVGIPILILCLLFVIGMSVTKRLMNMRKQATCCYNE